MTVALECKDCGERFTGKALQVKPCPKCDSAEVVEARGPGRPREVSDGEAATNQVVRLGGSDRAELDALVSDGKGSNRSEAVRGLIRESARRRARRAK